MITATATNIQVKTQVAPGMSSQQFAAMFARTGLFAFALFMIVAAVHPDMRAMIRASLVDDSRHIVSTAQGHLAGDNRLFTVAKVRTADALALEIFESLGNGQQRLVEKIALPEQRDGFFDFNGQATNLAIDDINGDGRPEILAPSFDNNLVGHLNVYNFDPESNAFQKVIR